MRMQVYIKYHLQIKHVDINSNMKWTKNRNKREEKSRRPFWSKEESFNNWKDCFYWANKTMKDIRLTNPTSIRPNCLISLTLLTLMSSKRLSLSVCPPERKLAFLFKKSKLSITKFATFKKKSIAEVGSSNLKTRGLTSAQEDRMRQSEFSSRLK